MLFFHNIQKVKVKHYFLVLILFFKRRLLQDYSFFNVEMESYGDRSKFAKSLCFAKKCVKMSGSLSIFSAVPFICLRRKKFLMKSFQFLIQVLCLFWSSTFFGEFFGTFVPCSKIKVNIIKLQQCKSTKKAFCATG